jgi:tetratricopeptide (TPR) repeat protein
MDLAALPEPASAALLDIQAQEATKRFNEKKYAEAEALALQLLDLAPNQRLALRVVFEIRKAQNRTKPAEILARRLAALPGAPAVRAAANTQLAQYIISQGRYADAYDAAAAALIAAPRDASTHHVLGVVLTETGRIQPGEAHYRRALELLGREDGLVLANLAWNLKLQGRLDEAAEVYEKALALRADNKRGAGGYAQVEMARGNPEKAIALLDEALTKWPEERTLRLLRALADLVLGQPQAVLDRLSQPPEELLAAELSARGQALARLERPAEAVIAYANAKKMLRERNGQAYEPAEFVEKAAAYKAYFTADRMLPLPRAAAAQGPQPMFLLGFARAGTSLLEQMLVQVPGFAAGDEFAPVAELIPLIARLAGGGAAYPEALDDWLVGGGMELPAQLRARYTQARIKLGLGRPEQKFITDRAASNAWHLGLIKLLFPDAPVIHVIRHPLDVMLSVLSQDRRLEGNCHVSMAAAARQYALTMEMIRHYRANLTLRYLAVRYEDLVRAPVASLREVLEFAGADTAFLPHEATLRANAARPRDPVPAHFALREKLHERGVFRYRAYEAVMPNLFAELRDVLNPWIEELGY